MGNPIKVGQKYQHLGSNAFVRVCHIDDNHVFIVDEVTNELYASKRQNFTKYFKLVNSKSEIFCQNLSQFLLLSMIAVPLVLSIFALCQYLGVNAVGLLFMTVLMSVMFASWEYLNGRD